MNERRQAGYELLEHTADAGVLAWGRDPGAAFAQATRGMFAIVLGRDPGEWQTRSPTTRIPVEVEGGDWPSLLVNWLAELVFRFDTDGLVARNVAFEQCEPPVCLGTVDAAYLAPGTGADGVGIKAVTYHQLDVHIKPRHVEVRVFFDI